MVAPFAYIYYYLIAFLRCLLNIIIVIVVHSSDTGFFSIAISAFRDHNNPSGDTRQVIYYKGRIQNN